MKVSEAHTWKCDVCEKTTVTPNELFPAKWGKVQYSWFTSAWSHYFHCCEDCVGGEMEDIHKTESPSLIKKLLKKIGKIK